MEKITKTIEVYTITKEQAKALHNLLGNMYSDDFEKYLDDLDTTEPTIIELDKLWDELSDVDWEK